MEFPRNSPLSHTPPGFQESSSLFASDGDEQQQVGNYLSFLNNNNDDESADLFGFSGDNVHKRSFSASDVCSEETGFVGGGGYGRFGHGLGDDFDSLPGPDYVSSRQQEEIARMKLAQRQRLAAAQFLAASGGGGSPMSFDKDINFLLHSRNGFR